MITLSDGTVTLILPPDMHWSDANTWQPVVQQTDYSLTGALVVESASRLAGREITLRSEGNCAWLSGADVAQLGAWAQVAGQVLTLAFYNNSYAVIYRHNDTPALEAEMVRRYGDPDATDRYTVIIKLMEI